MSKWYSCRPSDIMAIEDEYTAFCFDEACMLIRLRLENKEKPNYKEIKKEEELEFHSFKDFYKQFNN